MAQQSWWGRLRGAVEREYERRVRRASGVLDYTAKQHQKDNITADTAPGRATKPIVDTPEDEAAIVNVPRGTRLSRSNTPPPSADQPPPDKQP